jgi:hypothetical protein
MTASRRAIGVATPGAPWMQGIAALAEVRWAVLETTGLISFIQR